MHTGSAPGPQRASDRWTANSTEKTRVDASLTPNLPTNIIPTNIA